MGLKMVLLDPLKILDKYHEMRDTHLEYIQDKLNTYQLTDMRVGK